VTPLPNPMMQIVRACTLGHSQISLTLNTYSHVLPALQHDAAARINAILER
jgi:hypothetical protein